MNTDTRQELERIKEAIYVLQRDLQMLDDEDIDLKNVIENLEEAMDNIQNVID